MIAFSRLALYVRSSHITIQGLIIKALFDQFWPFMISRAFLMYNSARGCGPMQSINSQYSLQYTTIHYMTYQMTQTGRKAVLNASF